MILGANRMNEHEYFNSFSGESVFYEDNPQFEDGERVTTRLGYGTVDETHFEGLDVFVDLDSEPGKYRWAWFHVMDVLPLDRIIKPYSRD
jgi:hypothetical protein